MERITTSGRRFLDEHGRERIFNGVNLCDKGQYIPKLKKREYHYGQHEETIRALAENGVNVLRLGIVWDAIEHTPGVYDEAYLDGVKRTMDLCEKYGIYVYLDMHQDLYAGFGDGGGDGAPAWACLTDGHRYKKEKFVWAEGYFFGKATQHCFDNFWANKPCHGRGVQDAFAEMWAHLAERFGDHPALFGFDMLNEPFPGSDGGKVFQKLVGSATRTFLTDRRIKKGALLRDAVNGDLKAAFDQFDGAVLKKTASVGTQLIQKFDEERYTPFLNRVSAAIREKTPNGILFIDNCYYSNLAIPCHAGPITVNGQEQASCFSPHGYDFMVDTPLYKHASNSRVDAIFGTHAETQERLNVPVLVGEWGGASEGTDWLPHIQYLLDFFDAHRWSQTYWCFTEGLLNEPIMQQLNRPAPRAVTGTIERYCHDRKANTFTLVYDQAQPFDAPTVIYTPQQPKAVHTDGTVAVKPNFGSGCLIEIVTEPERHEVLIEL